MQAAVKLDPDYLNAWKHILQLANSVYIGPEILNAAALNLMRLDPLGRHEAPNLGQVRDLKALWDVAAKRASLRIKPPETLLPLAASAAEMRKSAADRGDIPRGTDGGDETASTAGDMIAHTRIVSTVGEILDAH